LTTTGLAINPFIKKPKNYYNEKYFLFIAILVISIIAIFSCRKSIEPEVNTGQMMNSSNKTELKIQSFINRLNSDLKDEKTYSIDSAIWYCTAVLNYTYAIYDSSFLHFNVDTSNFTVGIDKDGKVKESDLEDVIEQMTDSLKAFFANLPVNIKHVMLCMAYETGSTNEILDLGFVSVVGYGYSSTYYGSFGPIDHWYAIWNWGDCYDYSRNGDAGVQIEYKLLHPLVQNDPDWRIFTIPGTESIFTNIDPADYPYPSSPSGHRGYIFLGQGNWIGPQCLPPNDLNFYISSNGVPYIIDHLKPQGKDFVMIDVYGDIIWLYDEYYEEQHLYNITYSIIYKTIVPATSL
jgi:hypothetical protein